MRTGGEHTAAQAAEHSAAITGYGTRCQLASLTSADDNFCMVTVFGQYSERYIHGMTTTVSVKLTDEIVSWLDGKPEGRSAYLRQLVENARRAEIDNRDLAIIEAYGGDVADLVVSPDAEEWAKAATEWDGVDL